MLNKEIEYDLMRTELIIKMKFIKIKLNKYEDMTI